VADPSKFVMPGFIPSIHVFFRLYKDVDGRNKSGHDSGEVDLLWRLR